MRVHRFMSDAEYKMLVAGRRLMNDTDHAKERGLLTDSIGFCFFTEDPDKAIHWLSGCCYPDHCVTLDIPDHMLHESTATYRDPERSDLMSGPIIGGHLPTMQKREYCLTSYALSDGVHILADTEEYRRYADMRRAMQALGLINRTTMAMKKKPTTPHRRTREELVVDTFRYMIRNGDAVRREIEFLNRCGGTDRKVIYKIEPADSLTNEIAELIERINPKKEQ